MNQSLGVKSHGHPWDKDYRPGGFVVPSKQNDAVDVYSPTGKWASTVVVTGQGWGDEQS